MPSASVSTAIAVNEGSCRNFRQPNRTSSNMLTPSADETVS